MPNTWYRVPWACYQETGAGVSSENDDVPFRNSAKKYDFGTFFEDLDPRIEITGLDFQESY